MPRSRHKGRKKNNLERAARKGKKLYDVRRKRYYDPGSKPQPRNPTKVTK